MQVFGHRGAAGHAPENTLPSIRKALEMKVDGIEFDVRVTLDRVPVVIHDETIDRTTSESGRVAGFSLARLHAIVPDGSDAVPTLLDALREIGTATRINVELKEIEACGPTLSVLHSATEENLVRADQLLLTSFDLAAVKWMRARTSRYAVGLLTKGIPDSSYWDIAEQLGATSANIDLESVNREFVQTAHRHELEVMVYTVNSYEDAERMSQLGADTIFSDVPNRVRA